MNLPNITQARFQGSRTARVGLGQTEALSYLLEAVAEVSDIGFFRGSSGPSARIRGLFVDEDVVLAAAVTVGAVTAWRDQLQDSVISFNATDNRGGPALTMFSLEDDLLAGDCARIEGTLEGVKEHLFVAYIQLGGVRIARYR